MQNKRIGLKTKSLTLLRTTQSKYSIGNQIRRFIHHMFRDFISSFFQALHMHYTNCFKLKMRYHPNFKGINEHDQHHTGK